MKQRIRINNLKNKFEITRKFREIAILTEKMNQTMIVERVARAAKKAVDQAQRVKKAAQENLPSYKSLEIFQSAKKIKSLNQSKTLKLKKKFKMLIYVNPI